MKVGMDEPSSTVTGVRLVREHDVSNKVISLQVDDIDEIDVEYLFSPSYHLLLSEELNKKHSKLYDQLTKWHRKGVVFYTKYSNWVNLVIFIIYYAVGVEYYRKTEGWGYIDCFYFVSETVATIGTGYFHPTTDSSKIFTIPYIIVGVTIIIYFCSNLVKTVLTDTHDEIIFRLHHYFRGQDIPLNRQKLSSYRVYLSITAVFFCLLSGTLFFKGNEGWSTINSIYWSVSIMTTVGYGDLSIKYDSTRVFGIFYIFISVLIFSVAFNNALDNWKTAENRRKLQTALKNLASEKFTNIWCSKVLEKNKKLEGQVLSSTRSSDRLQTSASQIGDHHDSIPSQIDQDVTDVQESISVIPGSCGKERFILYVLMELGILDYQHHVLPLAKKFELLDTLHTGQLTHKELIHFHRDVENISRAAQGRVAPTISLDFGTVNPLLGQDTVEPTKQPEVHRDYFSYAKVSNKDNTSFDYNNSNQTNEKSSENYYSPFDEQTNSSSIQINEDSKQDEDGLELVEHKHGFDFLDP